MDFIENDALAAEGVKKVLGLKHHPTDARELAVEILNVRKVLAQAGFSNTANTSQPGDGAFLPSLVEQSEPVVSMYHTKVYLHLVTSNASVVALGQLGVFGQSWSMR